MRYRLACFDLDGTLLDTLAGLVNALNAARRMNGLAPQSEEQIRGFIGNGVEKLIERSLAADPGTFDNDLKQKLLEDRIKYYAANCLYETFPYDGITEAVSKLKFSGMMLAVVTNKDEIPTNILIDHFFPGILIMFAALCRANPENPSPKLSGCVLMHLTFSRKNAYISVIPKLIS